MDLGLKGAIVLVTGGSKGIGLACARAFAAEGARIAICSRSEANISRALKELPGAFGIPADLVDDKAAAHMVDRVEREFGPIAVRFKMRWRLAKGEEREFYAGKVAVAQFYAARVLLEGCLTQDLVRLKGRRYRLSNSGYVLLHDETVRVNMDFTQDVCYQGAFHMGEALAEAKQG